MTAKSRLETDARSESPSHTVRPTVRLRELKHRVKNDLQAIGSMLQLRLTKAHAEETRRELRAVANYVETLTVMHDQLDAAPGGDRVDLRAYVGRLCTTLVDLTGAEGQRIRLALDLAELSVDEDVARALGLIINEFTTNAAKYAFADGAGTISVALRAVSETEARLRLKDDGVGLPDRWDRTPGLGMRLISMLAGQIGGTAGWRVDGGTELTVAFPI